MISVQHSEENQPPVVTLEPALTTTQDRASSLRPAGRTMACRRERLRWAGSTPAMACISAMPIGLKPGHGLRRRTYALTFTADDGLLKSSKTVTVTVGEATGKAPADFCRYHGEVYGVAEGRLTVMKSDKDALTVGEDGFLGPFANEGIRSAGRCRRRGAVSSCSM